MYTFGSKTVFFCLSQRRIKNSTDVKIWRKKVHYFPTFLPIYNLVFSKYGRIRIRFQILVGSGFQILVGYTYGLYIKV